MRDATKKAPTEKVDNTVLKEFEKEEYVTVLIELDEQVDTTKVAQEAKNHAGVQATAYNQKMAARHAVVDTLQQTAETSQAPILSALEKAQEAGDVQSFESFYIMNVISVTATKDVIEKISAYPEVSRIKENEQVDIILPEIAAELPMVTADGVEWNIDRVQAPDTWNEFGVTGEGIVVGVIDTGVEYTHEALMENYRGYNPDDPSNPDSYGNWLDRLGSNEHPVDTHGHGTHVTGTVLGQDPDGLNKVGVAPDAEWIAARVFSAAGGTQADLLAAGEYMIAPEGDPGLAPDIVQNSWGGQPGVDDWYRPIVTAWRDAGQLPVFSAGNSGPGASTVTPPANYPESYAVAATDSNDGVASFSSRGPSQYDGDQKPNISAPGVNIRSSVPGGGYEGGWNGTSMASPHIAGVAAMLLSIDASLTPDEIEAIMDETADPLTDSQYTDVPNDGYGVGLVNAYEAVAMIADGTGFISGQVLTEGSDDEAPEITHSPIDFSFSGMDIPVTAEITDNVAVVEAELIVSHEDLENDISIPMSLTSGDYLDGEYRGVVPHDVALEPGFSYQIAAHDFGGNTTATEEFWVEIEFGIVPGEYSQDFSDYPIGWQMDGSWEWGEPTGDSPDPVVGDKLIGTNLAGNYPPSAADLLVLPPLDLRDAEEASLRMNHWYDIEANWDYGYIGISDDLGNSWEVVETISARDQEWKNLFIDLNPYTGSENPILVAFEFTSDSIIEYLGWYIDNVELIAEDTEAPDAPTNLAAEASSAGISLNWEASLAPDTKGYNIYRSTVSGTDYDLVGETTNTSFSDHEVEPGNEYFYVITAFDYSDNESEFSNEASGTPPQVEVIFHSDFNDDNGEFISGGENNSWEWGAPTSGPGEAFVGDNLWATNLDGNYNNNEDSWIMSPEVDLSSDLTTAALNFSYWQNIENNWDYGYVEVTTDGGESWDTIESFTNVFEFWDTAEISLNDYIGETIQFRFALDTDGSVTRNGWYIDDVYVLGSSDSDQSLGIIGSSSVGERVEIDTSRKKSVDIDPTFFFEKTSAVEYKAVSSGASLMSSDGLPVAGTVTVLESDRTTHTNPMTGEYTLRSAATEEGETVTVLAEAYGFYSEEVSLEVTEDETTYHNFMLDPLPTGDIEGTVTNLYTDLPVEDATIRLVEDPRVPAVSTDEAGTFSMEDIYEGDYTVRVTAQGYHPAEVEISVTGGESVEVDVALEQFVGYEDEIAYDNGVAENALVLNAAGNGLAVKFTPEETAELRGVNMYVWDTDFPTPGGNDINIVVYDTDDNGNPNERVVGPVPVEVERGAWNYIDLSEHSFVTDGDFFISTLQDEIGDYSPAVGTDEEFPNAERSYLYVDGAFQPHFDNGNFMIRANVAYSLEAPTLTSPEDGLVTSDDTIEVTGEFAGDGDVTIYNNGEEAAVTSTEDGEFSATVSLTEGENEIFAEGDADGLPLPSETVIVIKDSVAPEIVVESPVDGMITNQQVVDVSGTVADENLDTVTVNGSTVEVDDEGAFFERVIVDEGENTFTVEAIDLAGNSAEETATIYVDWTAPTIENIEPSEDVTIAPGESFTVSFESDSEGGEASFVVTIPSAAAQTAAVTEMEEVAPGYYEGTWTAPEAAVENAVIEITMTDAAGNTSRATADGRLTIATDEDDEDDSVPATPAELYEYIEEMTAEGEISHPASKQLANTLATAERHYDGGRVTQAISHMNRFKDRINSSQMRDTSEEVKQTLRNSADLIMDDWAS